MQEDLTVHDPDLENWVQRYKCPTCGHVKQIAKRKHIRMEVFVADLPDYLGCFKKNPKNNKACMDLCYPVPPNSHPL